jgi:hypothetical protein
LSAHFSVGAQDLIDRVAAVEGFTHEAIVLEGEANSELLIVDC